MTPVDCQSPNRITNIQTTHSMDDDARSVDRLQPALPSTRHHHNAGSNSENKKTLSELWTAARSSRTAVIVVVALALFTDMILYDVIVPILPAILRRVKQDESLMGLLLGVYAAGLLLFTPVFGVWSDRSGSRRTPMLLGQLGLGLSTLLFIYSRNIVLLMIARFLQGKKACYCVYALISFLLFRHCSCGQLDGWIGITGGHFSGSRIGLGHGTRLWLQHLGILCGPTHGRHLDSLLFPRHPLLHLLRIRGRRLCRSFVCESKETLDFGS